MMFCISCSSAIHDDVLHYLCSDMGPEIVSIMENNLRREVDETCIMCEHCFTDIMQIMYAAGDGTSSAHENEHNVCAWCQSSLFRRRTHALSETERQMIAEHTAPQSVPDGSLVCYRCWVRVRRNQAQQEVQIPLESSLTASVSTNTCVWCLCSLARTRRHTLPEGPERNEVIARIFPRQIPVGGLVCYACWMSAHRNVQRAGSVETPQNAFITHHHHHDSCALCGISLFRRQTHAVPSGAERDELAASIYPRELSGHLLCANCWQINVRRTASISEETEPQLSGFVPYIELDDYSHTTSSSTSCFVPSCSNSERFRVPVYLKKIILTTQKVFVTEGARICYEHKSLFNWEFLGQYEFSKTFTKEEIQSMLNLSVQEIDHYLDFENINNIENNIFHFWTGLTKDNYNIVLNQIRPALRCKSPENALGVYLVKVRTGESHRRISSLLNTSKTTITRLLNAAREALDNMFVPLHLGINRMSREDLINRNLVIPEGLFGNRAERVPIIICDGTYIYLQKSSNYLFQKKTYSLHKYRNLIKPFLFVASDGHIIDVFGPYPATESDANIIKSLFQNEDGELRTFFRPNDVFILDRGFRDAVPFLELLGYKIYKPESLDQGETQLPTIKANKSRCVTLCRWVVEVVNGRFKRDFKLFRQEYFNLAATHLMVDLRICASIINAFHPVIENRPDAEIILNRALTRKEMPNILAQLINDNRINRFRAQFTSINAQLPELDIFPVMTLSELTLFALGIYQIKQAKSYYGEHLRQHGSFRVEISDSLEVVSQATATTQDPILIRGRIKSRHLSGRIYYTYILIDTAGANWENKIISYYCSCISGKRTVGCCAHTMTIVWYLGWARHQTNVSAPALFLDDVLVREDND